MANESGGGSGISWLIRMVVDPASRRRVKESFRESGKEAGDAFSSVAKKAFDKLGISSGDTVAKQLLERMKARFNRDMGDTREALFRGLIDKKEAEKRGREAARDFNAGILKGIENLSKQGKLSDKDFVQLTRSLKTAGLEGGEQLNEGIASKFKNLPGLLRGILGGAVMATIVAGLRRVTRAVGQLIDESTRAAQAGRGFRNIAVSRGLDPTEVLRDLRAATLGVVPAMELMQRAQFALNADLPLTSKNIGELAFLSRRLAEAQGRDATEGFQRMINGIVKGEQNLLEELGILGRMEDALKRYTRETGNSTEALSGQQKIMLFYNQVVEEARRKVAGLGEEHIEAGQRVDQVTTFLTDLTRETAGAILQTDGVRAFFEAFGMGAANAADRIETIADGISSFVEVLPLLLSGNVTAARVGAARSMGQRQGARARQGELDELKAINDIETATAKRVELQGQLNDLQRESSQDLQAQKRLQEEILAVDIAIDRLRSTDDDEATGEWEPVQMSPYGKAVVADAGAVGKMAVEDFARAAEQRLKDMQLQLAVQPFIEMDPGAGMLADLAAWSDQTAAVESQRALAETWADIWRDSNSDVEQAVTRTAYGIANTWKDAFSLIIEDGANASEFLGTMFKGIAGAALGGLADYAATQMAKEIAAGFGMLAEGFGFTAIGMLPSGQMAKKSAAMHFVSAAKWSVLAGLAGAAQGAVAGGGGGGMSGGIPTGARDPLGRLSERADAGPGEVIVYIDPFNPGNPVHVQKVGRAMDMSVRLAGTPEWARRRP